MTLMLINSTGEFFFLLSNFFCGILRMQRFFSDIFFPFHFFVVCGYLLMCFRNGFDFRMNCMMCTCYGYIHMTRWTLQIFIRSLLFFLLLFFSLFYSIIFTNKSLIRIALHLLLLKSFSLWLLMAVKSFSLVIHKRFKICFALWKMYGWLFVCYRFSN